jgi:hypothetical protein
MLRKLPAFGSKYSGSSWCPDWPSVRSKFSQGKWVLELHYCKDFTRKINLVDGLQKIQYSYNFLTSLAWQAYQKEWEHIKHRKQEDYIPYPYLANRYKVLFDQSIK